MSGFRDMKLEQQEFIKHLFAEWNFEEVLRDSRLSEYLTELLRDIMETLFEGEDGVTATLWISPAPENEETGDARLEVGLYSVGDKLASVEVDFFEFLNEYAEEVAPMVGGAAARGFAARLREVADKAEANASAFDG